MLRTIRGFKDFIMRGNVIDLSVGIVIGAAFTALVTAVTKSLLEPLIRVFSGGELAGTWKLNDVTFDWAASVNALITFVITAAVLYFLVVTPMNRLAERRRKGEEPESKAPSEEILLLREIRDALRAGAPAAEALAPAGPPNPRGAADPAAAPRKSTPARKNAPTRKAP
jgi:large conductance mechanosensitive channel